MERLYADIEPCKGATVHGVIYRLTAGQLARLDRYEGVPTNTYYRFEMNFEFDGGRVRPVQIYRITPAAAHDRRGMPYPEAYRAICSEGARQNRIPNAFTRRRNSR